RDQCAGHDGLEEPVRGLQVLGDRSRVRPRGNRRVPRAPDDRPADRLRGRGMSGAAVHRQIIERFWRDLYRRDFDALATYFAEDGEYTDVPTPDDDVARGPAQIIARLKLGLEPLSGIYHHLRHM